MTASILQGTLGFHCLGKPCRAPGHFMAMLQGGFPAWDAMNPQAFGIEDVPHTVNCWM